MATVALVSLGCPKNLVDSEGACAELAAAGYELVVDEAQADVIVINTCGFIESAREESVEAISQAVERKRRGTCRAVVVIGCLAQRYGRELIEAEPEIDAVLGVGHAGRVADAVEAVLGGRRIVEDSAPPTCWHEPSARLRSTPRWTAYVKISDGCDNRCSYCAIPSIRGPFRSRPQALVIDEAKRLADDGVRELILVGQDLTQYGADLGHVNLAGLLARLAEINGLHWIRLMYCYPTKITRELIEVIAGSEKIVKYIDMPLQHGDDRVLRAMNRRGSTVEYLRVIDELREACPEIALRSSFITGFPGETPEAFDNLLAFVERIRFDRVSAFAYSREEGTAAWALKPQVSGKTSAARLDRLMRLQKRISLEKNKRLVGKTLEILVETRTHAGAIGRSYRDAPEIDGIVHVTKTDAAPGEFVRAKIAAADEYDLWGETTEENIGKSSSSPA